MPEIESSSLDRLVRTRGPMLLGVPAGITGSRTWTIAGAVQVLAGGAALGAAIFSGAAAELQAFGFIGVWFTLQGLYYLGTAGNVNKRAHAEGTPQARLTKEADGLLRRLIEGLDDSMPLPWRRAPRRSADLLVPEAFQLLDAAARQYNRVQGVLTIEGERASPTLHRLGPNIRAAADEALAEVLHAAALIQQFPESAAVHRAGACTRLEALDELAGTVERVQSTGPAGPALAAPASRLDEVLEELRSDQLARIEIASPEPAVQELKVGNPRSG